MISPVERKRLKAAIARISSKQQFRKSLAHGRRDVYYIGPVWFYWDVEGQVNPYRAIERIAVSPLKPIYPSTSLGANKQFWCALRGYHGYVYRNNPPIGILTLGEVIALGLDEILASPKAAELGVVHQRKTR